MAPSVRPVLLLTLMLSGAETPSCVRVPWRSSGLLTARGEGVVRSPIPSLLRRRRGWTPNSAGYLLGPVLPLPQRADRGGKEKTALEILDLWKAIDRLPYSHSQGVPRRTRREPLSNPETGDLGVLSKNIPREGEVPPS
ncbi:LOW QUALITY PROTEIN: galanin-like peptide [Molossus nigricans]